MKPLIDLHCDTLINYMDYGDASADALNDPNRTLSLDKISPDCNRAQMYAVFTDKQLKGKAAADFFDRSAELFYTQMEKFSNRVSPCTTAEQMEKAWAEGKTAAFLTIEDGRPLAGELDRIQTVYDAGVRLVTLVWNFENELASGHDTDNGFSPFGRAAVRELGKIGIALDVSHLNDRGFYELLDIHDGTIVASHSNCRSVCSHKRNLTDDMIKHIAERRGLIGLNFYTPFITDSGRSSNIEDFYAHVRHFLELGAEDVLALGSDFDGATVPAYLDGPQKEEELYDRFISIGLGRELTEKIMYKNAHRFIKDNFR